MNTVIECTATAILNAPLEEIDLTEWLFTLKDHDYRSCSSAHIAGGVSLTEDGRRISINIERVADNLLVQHYREEVETRNHCRAKSRSDSISALGNYKLDVTWELTLRSISSNTCEFSNRILVEVTAEFQALLDAAGVTDFEKVRMQMLHSLRMQNEDETPHFARDIQTKAHKGIWRAQQSL